MPRSRSLRRRRSSSVVRRRIETQTSKTAAARMVGRISSLIPENIFHGMVRERTLDAFGAVHCLVNNAGRGMELVHPN